MPIKYKDELPTPPPRKPKKIKSDKQAAIAKLETATNLHPDGVFYGKSGDSVGCFFWGWSKREGRYIKCALDINADSSFGNMNVETIFTVTLNGREVDVPNDLKPFLPIIEWLKSEDVLKFEEV